MSDEHLREFLRQIVNEKAQVELDKDIEEQLISDLYDSLERQIYRSLLDQLSDEKLAEMESKDLTPEETLRFLELSGVAIQNTLTKTLIQFRAAYLG